MEIPSVGLIEQEASKRHETFELFSPLTAVSFHSTMTWTRSIRCRMSMLHFTREPGCSRSRLH